MVAQPGSSDSAFLAFSLDLITAIASGQIDLGECEQVELDDGLECLRSEAVAQAVWQSAEPIGVLGLERQQFANRIAPTLGAATSIDWPACSDRDGYRLRQSASAMASLALSVAQGVLANRFTSSRHGPVFRYVCARRSWRDPAGERPVQVRGSARLVVSVASRKVTTAAKRTQQLCGVGD